MLSFPENFTTLLNSAIFAASKFEINHHEELV